MPTPILMPALSPTMEEGTLAKWLVKEGDSVEAGDVIAEIETDKATMEVEAVDEGTIGRIVVAEGTENVAVNNPIAYILEEGESADDIPAGQTNGSSAPQQAEPAPRPAREQDAREQDPAPPSQGSPQTGSAPPQNAEPAMRPPAQPSSQPEEARIFASPLARRMAVQENLDLSALQGSGPHGRIVRRDIEQALKGPRPAPAKGDLEHEPAAPAQRATRESIEQMGIRPGSYDEVKLDSMRKTIARRMTESKQQVPHFPLTIDCEIDKLLALRKELNDKAGEASGAGRAGGDGEDRQVYRLSVNDFIVRASALALKKLPAVNASFAGDRALLHHHADIAVAVAVEGGLITPIVFDAETKGLAEISREMKDKAARAHARKLLPEDYLGGTFSISNLGMFGVREFAAVINQPHGAILAVGVGEPRPVVRDGSIQIATVMTCTLSCDHRVVDGALGARWLQIFKRFIEDPVTMLL